MNMNAIRVGVVGCGAISSVYLDTMIRHFSNVLEVRLCSSAHMNSAQAQSERYGITAVSTEELLACPDIDLVVNLTPVPAHEAIIRKALERGKHVYSEKTLTESLKQSAQLLALAEKRGRLLCCAPDTMLSAGVQTARRALQEGMIGQVTSAEMNMNRDYGAFYPRLPFLLQPGAGCGMDIGPYFISCAVYLLGPVAEVAGFSDVSRPCREGGLKIQNENRFMAALRFRSGVLGTLHMNADSGGREEPYLAIYGTKGTLRIPEPNKFSRCAWLDQGGERRELPCTGGYTELWRGAGVAEMARALLAGRAPMLDARFAYHTQEVIQAVYDSSAERRHICVRSDLPRHCQAALKP